MKEGKTDREEKRKGGREGKEGRRWDKCVEGRGWCKKERKRKGVREGGRKKERKREKGRAERKKERKKELRKEE